MAFYDLKGDIEKHLGEEYEKKNDVRAFLQHITKEKALDDDYFSDMIWQEILKNELKKNTQYVISRIIKNK